MPSKYYFTSGGKKKTNQKPSKQTKKNPTKKKNQNQKSWQLGPVPQSAVSHPDWLPRAPRDTRGLRRGMLATQPLPTHPTDHRVFARGGKGVCFEKQPAQPRPPSTAPLLHQACLPPLTPWGRAWRRRPRPGHCPTATPLPAAAAGQAALRPGSFLGGFFWWLFSPS